MEAVQLANTSALLAEIQSHLEVARTLSTGKSTPTLSAIMTSTETQ